MKRLTAALRTVLRRRGPRPRRYVGNDGRPTDHDPTYGRIDPDVQAAVQEMGPATVADRVVWEANLQRRKDGRRHAH